jgi:hypothetical protein
MRDQAPPINFGERKVGVFICKAFLLCGELEGIMLIGKLCPPAWPVVAEARLGILAELKALIQAFHHARAAEIRDLVLGRFPNLEADLETVEPDVELLTMLQEGLGGIH